jgi:RimJ/RimL family protein N-acetyltransferase
MSREGFTHLESERLILRRFAYSDLAPFLTYRNDPEVARYQDWESCTEREALDFTCLVRERVRGDLVRSTT